MQRMKITNHKYGLLILATLIIVSLVLGISGWRNERMMQEALYGADSPVAAPHQWFGISCKSEIRLPDVPFTIQIAHRPGKSRDVVDEAIQQLPSQNSTPDGTPYSAEMLSSYLIMKTRCFERWQDIFDSWNWMTRGPLDDLLPTDRTPTEADYRFAILQVLYPDEFDTANRIFPLEAAIHSTLEKER